MVCRRGERSGCVGQYGGYHKFSECGDVASNYGRGSYHIPMPVNCSAKSQRRSDVDGDHLARAGADPVNPRRKVQRTGATVTPCCRHGNRPDKLGHLRQVFGCLGHCSADREIRRTVPETPERPSKKSLTGASVIGPSKPPWRERYRRPDDGRRWSQTDDPL